MSIKTFVLKALLFLAGAALLIEVLPAEAALVLGSEVTNQGGSNVSTGSNFINTLSQPSTTLYGNTLPGGLANLVTPPPGIDSYNFYDDFIINIPNSSVNSVSSTIDFGNLFRISNLQVRLYAGSTPSLTPVGVIDGWSTAISAGSETGTVSVLPLTTLDPGNYVLEVRGLADGQYGGSYSGVLNVAAVPLPAAAWLLTSAIGVLGALRRRNVKSGLQNLPHPTLTLGHA